MNRRILFIVLGIIFCLFLIIIIGMMIRNKKDEYFLNEYEVSEGVKTELVGLFDSEDEAKETALLYGITFVSFDSGVAVYETTENAQTVIDRGKEKGYAPLSINRTVTAD